MARGSEKSAPRWGAVPRRGAPQGRARAARSHAQPGRARGPARRPERAWRGRSRSPPSSGGRAKRPCPGPRRARAWTEPSPGASSPLHAPEAAQTPFSEESLSPPAPTDASHRTTRPRCTLGAARLALPSHDQAAPSARARSRPTVHRALSPGCALLAWQTLPRARVRSSAACGHSFELRHGVLALRVERVEVALGGDHPGQGFWEDVRERQNGSVSSWWCEAVASVDDGLDEQPLRLGG